ncbi:MAG: alkyl hydroperoxide reductase [Planctomycetes bacterium]|nr:alkyl hydroperoxide reductase [Planctomycetota bacterium]
MLRSVAWVAVLVTVAVAQETPVVLGTQVTAAFTDLRWQPRTLADLGDVPATVVWFATIECPLVQRYLPRVQELAKDLAARRVPVLIVNVGPGDSLVDATAQVVEGAPAAIAAKDFDLSFARACGVERTVTAVVLDAQRRIVYRGRIDAQYGYGGVAQERGREDLRAAIDEVLGGRPVTVATTPVAGCKITPPAVVAGTVPTWSRDVAPLFQQHCQECHRQGGEGPFPLATVHEARKHAAMIAEVVLQGRMPPWYGSSRHGTFVNWRGLDAAQKQTIAAWVAGGMPEGEAATAPAPRSWPNDEWRIGKPDLILKPVAPMRVPAEGSVPYQYFVLPYRFEHDTWVEAIEILPSNKRVLHHCNMARVKFGERWSQDGFITGYVPGGDAMVLDPGTAVKIPAGSVLVLQAHYVTTGQPEEDRLRVGLRFPRVVVEQEVRVLIAADFRFEIPAGANAHPVRARRQFKADAVGIGLFVHMHVRGRDMAVFAEPEGGERQPLLLVPNYNFDWQQSYRWAPGTQKFAAGTRIAALAHFDNSRFNPFNPDADVAVKFGLETTDEMMYAFLFYVHEHERLALRVDPATGRVAGDAPR